MISSVSQLLRYFLLIRAAIMLLGIDSFLEYASMLLSDSILITFKFVIYGFGDPAFMIFFGQSEVDVNVWIKFRFEAAQMLRVGSH